jgi:hypothetical protein
MQCCLSSMVRMKYVVQYSATYDTTWDSVDIAVWSTIEQLSAMMCASLPALRPFIVAIGSNYSSRQRGRTDVTGHLHKRSTSSRHILKQTTREADIDKVRSAGERGITVTTRIDVVRTPRTWYIDSRDEDTLEMHSLQPLPLQPPPAYSKHKPLGL